MALGPSLRSALDGSRRVADRTPADRNKPQPKGGRDHPSARAVVPGGKAQFWEQNGGGDRFSGAARNAIVPDSTPLTCRKVIWQPLCQGACSVRNEKCRSNLRVSRQPPLS
jgi:hypothetical protein